MGETNTGKTAMPKSVYIEVDTNGNSATREENWGGGSSYYFLLYDRKDKREFPIPISKEQYEQIQKMLILSNKKLGAAVRGRLEVKIEPVCIN